MKLKNYITPLNIVFLLFVCSFFLPWFTYDAQMMGYRFGYLFLGWFAIQLIIIALYLTEKIRGSFAIMITELSLLANFAALLAAFGRWQEVCNIVGGWQWNDGFYTAQPGFWISAVLSALLFMLFQYHLVKRR